MTALEPMTLRPLTLGQLLDRAFRIYRKNFLVFLGIVALGVIPVNLIQYAASVINFPAVQRASEQFANSSSSAANPFASLAAVMAASQGSNLLVLILTFVLVSVVATGALVKAIEDTYLGRPVGIVRSYQQVLNSLFPLLIAMFLGGLMILVLILWAIVPCVGWVTGFGMLLFFEYAIYLLIPATVIIEGKRGIYAIQRAWDLVRRRFWWVLGFVIILGVLGWIIAIGPAAILVGAATFVSTTVAPAASEQARFAIQSAISQTVTVFFQLLYLPLQFTALVLMYFDLRVRTEGFDLAMLAASSEAAAAPAASVLPGLPAAEPVELTTPPPPPPEPNALITLNEVGYFAAITIGAIALCAILYGLLIALTLLLVGTSRGF